MFETQLSANRRKKIKTIDKIYFGALVIMKACRFRT